VRRSLLLRMSKRLRGSERLLLWLIGLKQVVEVGDEDSDW
jgi:hypothetical protein